MKQRKVIKRVADDIPHGVSAALQRATEQLQRMLEAEVVFGGEVDDDGVLHCVAVSPSGKAPIAPTGIEDFPESAVVLGKGAARLFAEVYPYSETDSVLCVPVVAGEDFRALLMAVTKEVPHSRMVRMFDEWSLMVAECVSGELAHRRLDTRDDVVGQLRDVIDLLFKLTSEPVIACDLDGRITRWNLGAETVYGWRVEDVMGEVLPMVPERHHAVAIQDIRRAVTSGPTASLEGLRHLTASGRKIEVRAISVPVLDSDGDVTGMVAVIQERSSRAQHAHAAPQGVIEAALARLTAPVTAVSGFAQLLDRHDVLNDPVVRTSALRSLATRCREITEIGEELRLATRLLDVKRAPRLVPESPETILRRAAERALGAEAARVCIEVSGEMRMVVDPECLEDTVIGLLRGLLRSHPSDSDIKVSVQPADEGLVIVMNASPGGMSIAEHPESSLGIHLARLFADTHGGSLGVRSETHETEVRLVVPSEAIS